MSSHDESEDEQLKYAIALSLQQAGPEEQDEIPEPIRPRSRDPSFGLLLLNRKQMEEERLARLAAKRSHSTSQGDDIGDMPATKRGRKSPANRLNDKMLIQYPDGVVKRTWAKGYDRTGDDIHIDEVLQTDQLLLAMFSSFQWNEPWLLSKIDLSRTKVLLAAYAADDAQVGINLIPSRTMSRLIGRTERNDAQQCPKKYQILFPSHAGIRQHALEATDPQVYTLSTHRGSHGESGTP